MLSIGREESWQALSGRWTVRCDAKTRDRVELDEFNGYAPRRRIAAQPGLLLGSGNDNLAKKLRMSCIVETKFVTYPSLDPRCIT